MLKKYSILLYLSSSQNYIYLKFFPLLVFLLHTLVITFISPVIFAVFYGSHRFSIKTECCRDAIAPGYWKSCYWVGIPMKSISIPL
jgi:hypothetical protein